MSKNKEFKPNEIDEQKVTVEESKVTNTETTEHKVVETPDIKETKPEVKPQSQVQNKPDAKEAHKANPVQTVVPSFRVGESVKIKKTTKVNINGYEIPSFAYRNTYRITKILPSRVILMAGQYEIAVKVTDIEKA